MRGMSIGTLAHCLAYCMGKEQGRGMGALGATWVL